MDFYIGVSIFGYILWNIFIIKSSDFSDEQLDIYCNCALYTPIPAFILAYMWIMFEFGLKDGDTGLFAAAVALAYMGPLFSYTLFCLCVKVKKLVTNKCKKDVNTLNTQEKLEITKSIQLRAMLEKLQDYNREDYKEYDRKAHMKELDEDAKLQALREIKEDLKEIKDTMTKMQEDIKLLENI